MQNRHRGRRENLNDVGGAEDTEANLRISFLPKTNSTQVAFQAVLRQSHTRYGTWSSIPRLSVHNILPTTSSVFRLMFEGNMEEFQRMLTTGAASLQDQDEQGRSLLFVSCYIFILPNIP
jgi:hypothetical protein